MAVPWIQVYSNLTAHPKTYALADALRLKGEQVSPQATAAGMLVGIWSWASQNAVHGDVTGLPARVLADAAGWRKKPETLLAALIACGWVDEDGGKRYLHEWSDYASPFIAQADEQRRKTRERVSRFRQRSRNEAENSAAKDGKTGNEPCNGYGGVTVTPCNAPTEQNPTEQNSTEQNRNLRGSSAAAAGRKETGAPTPKKTEKPGLAEIQAYCAARKNSVEAARFFDYYEANGWLVGQNPMRDWRAAVRRWERRDEAAAPRAAPPSPEAARLTRQLDEEWRSRVMAFHKANGGADALTQAAGGV